MRGGRVPKSEMAVGVLSAHATEVKFEVRFVARFVARFVSGHGVNDLFRAKSGGVHPSAETEKLGTDILLGRL